MLIFVSCRQLLKSIQSGFPRVVESSTADVSVLTMPALLHGKLSLFCSIIGKCREKIFWTETSWIAATLSSRSLIIWGGNGKELLTTWNQNKRKTIWIPAHYKIVPRSVKETSTSKESTWGGSCSRSTKNSCASEFTLDLACSASPLLCTK